ncbi:hypothetical protein G6F31_018790 [Rhizopus arrhizus]|nr:hypothetical protein G6F31_018790 [Rhizopus arrhizus]
MDDESGLGLRRIDFPHFFDADAVGLRIAAVVELEAFDQLAAQLAACAFAEHRVAGMQFHAGLVVVGVRAVAGDTHVAGGHAAHGAVFVVQHFNGSETGENVHAQRFGLCLRCENRAAAASWAWRARPSGTGTGTCPA